VTRAPPPPKFPAGPLALGEGFTLPLEAVTQTFGILAVRGAGKTYTAAVMVEEMVGAGLPVVVVDPVGVWWGLRSSADGTAPGLPIVILGGDHGDIPLEVAAGALVAEFVVEARQSVVLDLSRFRKGEMTRFMTDFAETLYRLNRAPLHLVIDEADAVAPQRPQRGEERLLGACEDLVRRGRARGLGVTLVTQRAAVLNKNVLTQIEVLIALRTIAPQDREAIDDWIRVHGTPTERETMMSSLASLPKGTAWFWSPGWLNVFRRVQIRRRRTFDSGATPDAQRGAAGATSPPALAPIDLDALKTRMAAMISRVEAEDPRALKKRIADLERALAEAKASAAGRLTAEQRDHVRSQLDALDTIGSNVRRALGLASAPPRVGSEGPRVRKASPGPAAPAPRLKGTGGARTPPPPAPPRAEPGSPLVGLKAGARTMLMRVAQFHPRGGLTRDQLGTLAGLSARSGTFGSYLSDLRSHGLTFEDGGRLYATPAGLTSAPPGLEILDERDLRTVWEGRLKAGERRMLAAVLAAPSGLSRVALAAAARISSTSGTFGSYLSKLRRNALVVCDGPQVRRGPAFELFAKGEGT
jgi:uncharacterized protein